MFINIPYTHYLVSSQQLQLRGCPFLREEALDTDWIGLASKNAVSPLCFQASHYLHRYYQKKGEGS